MQRGARSLTRAALNGWVSLNTQVSLSAGVNMLKKAALWIVKELPVLLARTLSGDYSQFIGDG